MAIYDYIVLKCTGSIYCIVSKGVWCEVDLAFNMNMTSPYIQAEVKKPLQNKKN